MVRLTDNLDMTIDVDWDVNVRKRATIRNRYNQIPHLTQDINGKVTKLQ